MRRFALVLLAACASQPATKPADAPATTTGAEAPPAPSASTSTPAPLPPAGKGAFHSLELASTSGKVDKAGAKDGALKPDGVKDIVFEAEMDGPAVAFVIVSVNATGQPDGAFSSDTYVGTQLPPSEASMAMQPGKVTSGIVIYENDKLSNASNGSLVKLGEGRHKLVMYVSSKEKGSFRAYAILDDNSVVTSPVAVVK